MKNKKPSSVISFLILIFLTAGAAYSQTGRKTAKKQTPATANQTVNRKSAETAAAESPEKGWKIAMIETFGVRSIAFPENLAGERKETTQNVKDVMNERLTYTSFYWEANRKNVKTKKNDLKLSVMLARYNEDEAWLDLDGERQTAEQKIAEMIEAKLKFKETDPERFIRADSYAVGGRGGSLYIGRLSDSIRQLEWTTVRSAENKLQRATVFVFYPPDEEETALKILDSLRFIE